MTIKTMAMIMKEFSLVPETLGGLVPETLGGPISTETLGGFVSTGRGGTTVLLSGVEVGTGKGGEDDVTAA